MAPKTRRLPRRSYAEGMSSTRLTTAAQRWRVAALPGADTRGCAALAIRQRRRRAAVGQARLDGQKRKSWSRCAADAVRAPSPLRCDHGGPHSSGEPGPRRVHHARCRVLACPQPARPATARDRSRSPPAAAPVPAAPGSRWRRSATGIGRGVGALWMGVAHSVGWVARGVGRQAATAKEIDPEHRRDGAGLLMLGVAILVGGRGLGRQRRPGRRSGSPTRSACSSAAWPCCCRCCCCTARSGSCASRPIPSTAAGRWSAGRDHRRHRRACCTWPSARRRRRDDNSGGLIGYGVGALLERGGHRLGRRTAARPASVLRPAGDHRDADQQGPRAPAAAGRRAARPVPPGAAADRRARGRGRRADEEPAKRRRPARRRQGALADIGLDPTGAGRDEDDRSCTTPCWCRAAKVPASRKAAASRPTTRRCPPGPSSWRSRRWRATTACRRPTCSARARRRRPAAAPTTRSWSR